MSDHAEPDDNDRGLLKLVNKLHKMSIRDMSLYGLLWSLAFRDGIAYPLAITGGSVRDAIQNNVEGMKDIDVVVGGTYDQVCDYLRNLFASHDKAVTESTLFTKESSKQFGQLKIMNIQVCKLYVVIHTQADIFLPSKEME